jgi:GNAT superfamily N-acetyltransferase
MVSSYQPKESIMQVQVRQIRNKRELREFMNLPAKIHKGHTNWTPPLYTDEWRYFNPKKNKSFSYCDSCIALAFRNSEIVGRAMGIINQRYNEVRKEKNARFGYLECWEDREVFDALLKYVEDWARERGMNKIVGPMGFTDQDPEGFLVEGFEYPSTIATYYNFEFMIGFLEAKGYTKEVDYVVYKLDIPKEIPEFYHRIFERATRTGEFVWGEFSSRKPLKLLIRPIFRVMNECFRDIYGYTPLDEEEMDDLAKRYLPVIDPRFVKVVTRENKVIAFVIGIPNFADGIRQAKGHLWPFGFIKILRSARKTKQLDLLLGGVLEEYRGRGLDVMMGLKMIESAQKAGFDFMDSHHELETNTKMRAEVERMGGKVYKRYRIFQKML